MKKKWMALLLAVLLVGMLYGCDADPEIETTEEAPETTEVEETIPVTIPEDGDPDDVTCKGSYSVDGDASAVAASVDGAELTNEMLRAYYWAEVAAYRAAGHDVAPDFDLPLDTQVCQIDDSVNSWQQYFLRKALNTWHSAQALVLQGEAEGLPAEEAYIPNLDNHAKYMTEMPAMRYHYSYSLETYHPNTMHQEYLDNIPTMLDALAGERGYADTAAMAKEAFGTSPEALTAAVELYNRGYMYFTSLSYYLENTQEETDAYFAEHRSDDTETGRYVDIRHILVVPDDIVQEDDTPAWAKKNTEPTEPVILEAVEVAQDGTVTCSEAAWEAGLADAEALLNKWLSDRNASEATFAELARKNSDDPGSTINGGSYRQIRQGQLMSLLDEWCFDESRQAGDTTILRSDYGYHILYFSGSTDIAYAQAEEDLTAQRQAELVTAAREKYPMEVRYSNISLTEADGTVSGSDVLYPDVAHERFPEVPLYMQQDYLKTSYGGFEIRTNGCGITTMSMLATYMTDDELTPPEMCARYGHYSFINGTDGRIFLLEPPVLGFYCREKTYEPTIAKQALADGYVVVSLQHKGYWTSGGHYILLEKMNEDGTIQVRDSNIFNYGKLSGHKIDRFEWVRIIESGSAFWVFEKKITNIPACTRCDEPEGVVRSLLAESYICEKCEPAMLRRETYLSVCGV